MLTKCSEHFRRTKATRLPCHPAGPIGHADQLALFAQWQNEGYQP